MLEERGPRYGMDVSHGARSADIVDLDEDIESKQEGKCCDENGECERDDDECAQNCECIVVEIRECLWEEDVHCVLVCREPVHDPSHPVRHQENATEVMVRHEKKN